MPKEIIKLKSLSILSDFHSSQLWACLFPFAFCTSFQRTVWWNPFLLGELSILLVKITAMYKRRHFSSVRNEALFPLQLTTSTKAGHFLCSASLDEKGKVLNKTFWVLRKTLAHYKETDKQTVEDWEGGEKNHKQKGRWMRDGRAAKIAGQVEKHKASGNKGVKSSNALSSRRIRIFILKNPTLDYNWKLVSAEKWIYDVIIRLSVEGSCVVSEGRGRTMNRDRETSKAKGGEGFFWVFCCFLEQKTCTKVQNHKCLDGEMEEEGPDRGWKYPRIITLIQDIRWHFIHQPARTEHRVKQYICVRKRQQGATSCA